MDIGGKIRNCGWLQGKLVPVSLLAELVSPKLAKEEKCHLLAVTQSCDLVHHCPDSEPCAVFLVVREINAVSPAFGSGRNPRRINFENSNLAYEAHAWEQISVARSELGGYDASGSPCLSDNCLGVIAGWLGKRFTRAAFPDAFNNRLANVSNKITKAIKAKQSLFSEILLRVAPFHELPPLENYEVVVYLMMRAEDYNDHDKLAKATETVVRLEELLGDCEGIKIVECQAVAEDDLSLAEFKMMLSWDFDYLTHREVE